MAAADSSERSTCADIFRVDMVFRRWGKTVWTPNTYTSTFFTGNTEA